MRNFKKAALTTVSLLLMVILVFSLYTIPYFHGTAYYYQDAAMRDSLSGSLDLLIVGSSHAFRAFDTEILDQELGCNSYNLACAMQTMRGRYFLLKEEVERNPVKTVVLEVSYNALTRNREQEGPEGDIYELARFSNPIDRVRYFFSTIYPSEYSKLYFDTLDRSSTAWEMLLRGQMKPYACKGFQGLDANDMTITAEEAEKLYHSDALNTVPDADNLEYFEKCMNLCKEKGIRVILVVTPLSNRKIITASGLDTIREWYQDRAAQYNCEMYDFNLIPTKLEDYPMNTGFYDTTHLSREGAAVFTRQLCRIMRMAADGEAPVDSFLPDYETLTRMTMEFLSKQTNAK